MSYMATVSFSGLISMHKGEVRDIIDPSLVEDLTKAGYIIPYEASSKKKDEPAKDEPAKTTKRKGKSNE